jgi:phosphoribosylanthranilate isomerase
VKFCGITRLEDAQHAAMLGVDALGFVFFADSPRYISPADARAIIQRLPPFTCKVGLFVDEDVDTVSRITKQTGIDIVQYHGKETPEKCVAGGSPFIKALQVSGDMNLMAACDRYTEAAAILLDTYDPAIAGGTGETFDWTLIPHDVPKPIILAGGLTSANVASAIRRVSPYAVDASSGIESSKGVKDVSKMKAFLDEVNGIER